MSRRIVITGATGLIGARLVADRLLRGDMVTSISRCSSRATTRFDALGLAPAIIEGDPTLPGAWQASIDGADAVIHLAGAGILDRRWTAAYKKVIRRSRVASTTMLVHAVERAASPPRVVVLGSAIGYYGDRGDEPLHEESEPGTGFLADVCVEWEGAAESIDGDSTRLVVLRTGVVLDSRGGALGRMVPLFRLGVGGPIGLGRAWFPWIHHADLVGLIGHALEDERLRGPVNGVGPHPSRNREVARTLGRVLRRPALLPVPPLALHLFLGGVTSSLSASQRVVPTAALAAGYTYRFTDLESALRDAVGRSI